MKFKELYKETFNKPCYASDDNWFIKSLLTEYALLEQLAGERGYENAIYMLEDENNSDGTFLLEVDEDDVSDDDVKKLKKLGWDETDLEELSIGAVEQILKHRISKNNPDTPGQVPKRIKFEIDNIKDSSPKRKKSANPMSKYVKDSGKDLSEFEKDKAGMIKRLKATLGDDDIDDRYFISAEEKAEANKNAKEAQEQYDNAKERYDGSLNYETENALDLHIDNPDDSNAKAPSTKQEHAYVTLKKAQKALTKAKSKRSKLSNAGVLSNYAFVKLAKDFRNLPTNSTQFKRTIELIMIAYDKKLKQMSSKLAANYPSKNTKDFAADIREASYIDIARLLESYNAGKGPFDNWFLPSMNRKMKTAAKNLHKRREVGGVKDPYGIATTKARRFKRKTEENIDRIEIALKKANHELKKVKLSHLEAEARQDEKSIKQWNEAHKEITDSIKSLKALLDEQKTRLLKLKQAGTGKHLKSKELAPEPGQETSIDKQISDDSGEIGKIADVIADVKALDPSEYEEDEERKSKEKESDEKESERDVKDKNLVSRFADTVVKKDPKKELMKHMKRGLTALHDKNPIEAYLIAQLYGIDVPEKDHNELSKYRYNPKKDSQSRKLYNDMMKKAAEERYAIARTNLHYGINLLDNVRTSDAKEVQKRLKKIIIDQDKNVKNLGFDIIPYDKIKKIWQAPYPASSAQSELKNPKSILGASSGRIATGLENLMKAVGFIKGLKSTTLDSELEKHAADNEYVWGKTAERVGSQEKKALKWLEQWILDHMPKDAKAYKDKTSDAEDAEDAEDAKNTRQAVDSSETAKKEKEEREKYAKVGQQMKSQEKAKKEKEAEAAKEKEAETSATKEKAKKSDVSSSWQDIEF